MRWFLKKHVYILNCRQKWHVSVTCRPPCFTGGRGSREVESGWWLGREGPWPVHFNTGLGPTSCGPLHRTVPVSSQPGNWLHPGRMGQDREQSKLRCLLGPSFSSHTPPFPQCAAGSQVACSLWVVTTKGHVKGSVMGASQRLASTRSLLTGVGEWKACTQPSLLKTETSPKKCSANCSFVYTAV